MQVHEAKPADAGFSVGGELGRKVVGICCVVGTCLESGGNMFFFHILVPQLWEEQAQVTSTDSLLVETTRNGSCKQG